MMKMEMVYKMSKDVDKVERDLTESVLAQIYAEVFDLNTREQAEITAKCAEILEESNDVIMIYNRLKEVFQGNSLKFAVLLISVNCALNKGYTDAIADVMRDMLEIEEAVKNALMSRGGA